MIEVSVSGLEQLQSLVSRLSLLPNLKDQIDQIFYDVMLEFYQSILQDPSIPEKYKHGIVYVWQPGLFIITYFVEPEWKRKEQEGKLTRVEWVVYRCIKRGYWGGEMRGVPEYTEATYIEDKWNAEKDTYINMLRDRIVSLIRSVLTV